MGERAAEKARPSRVVAVVREALLDAHRVGMDQATTEEWIAITIQAYFDVMETKPEERLLRLIFGKTADDVGAATPKHADDLTPMDALAVAQGRRTEAQRRVCSQTGCPGDGRYQPPGRGHLPDCLHDAVTWTWDQITPPGTTTATEGATSDD